MTPEEFSQLPIGALVYIEQLGRANLCHLLVMRKEREQCILQYAFPSPAKQRGITLRIPYETSERFFLRVTRLA
jgi:hypothetical protein